MSRPRPEPHPVNPARPRPLPGPTTPPRPTPPPRPGRHVLGIVGLIVALAAITVLADVWFMSALWGATRTAYYVPDSGDVTSALVVALFAVSTVVGLVVAPKPRPSRHLIVRSVRAALQGRRRRTSGSATAPGVEGSLGAVAPTPARPSTTSPVGGRAGTTYLSSTWRAAA